jgi:hypothetical protein
MEGSGLERTGHIRSHLSAGEQRLRIPGGDDVELAVVVELTYGVERVPCGRRSEGKSMFELGPLGLRRPPARQQSVRMLPRDAELSGQIGDRQSSTPQQRLPNLGFIAHGRRS